MDKNKNINQEQTNVKTNLNYNEKLGMYIKPSEWYMADLLTQEKIEEQKKEKVKIWDSLMIRTVKNFEDQSKCAAKKVCCLIVREDEGSYNILSIGLNGTPSGKTNCNSIWKRGEEKDEWYKKTNEGSIKVHEGHSKWSQTNEIHAEVNALAKCNKNGISTVGTIAYISYSPCLNCSKMLVAFGIRKVVFINKYDNFESDVKDFLLENGVEVIQHNGEEQLYQWKPKFYI